MEKSTIIIDQQTVSVNGVIYKQSVKQPVNDVILLSDRSTVSVDAFEKRTELEKATNPAIGVVWDKINGKAFALTAGYEPFDNAVEYCKAYSTPGTKPGDWYLMSRDEWLQAIQTIGEWWDILRDVFDQERLWYWTSTPYGESGAWYATLDYRNVYNHYRLISNWVRPCLAL